MTQQIGVVGLAVMGKNLAWNIESRGYSVSVYNRSSEKQMKWLMNLKVNKSTQHIPLEEFVNSLENHVKFY